MSQEKYRVGVCEKTLVKRYLKLQDADDGQLVLAMGEIDQRLGINEVNFDQKKRVLFVAYDAVKLALDDIETVLSRYNVFLKHSWWLDFKNSYYRYLDENTKDHAKQQPWSCHMPRHK